MYAKNISDIPIRWRIAGGSGDCPLLLSNCEKAAAVTISTNGSFAPDNFDCGLNFFPAESFPANMTLRYDSTLLLYNTSDTTVSLRLAWFKIICGENVCVSQ